MPSTAIENQARELAGEIDSGIQALQERNTPNVRKIRRRYSRRLKDQEAALVLALAAELIDSCGLRGAAYELIRSHPAAFGSLDRHKLEQLGRGINSWWTVDAFARTLAGPAWRRGLIGDEVIHRWARSPDLWWRRAALVSTVALNVRSRGGHGDILRTLAVCDLLIEDREDMVVKALSWALRQLVVHDPAAVREYLEAHREELAARVLREVNNKLTTGLKSP